MAFVDIPNKEYVDGKVDNIVVLSPNEPDSDQSKIWVKTTDDQVEIPTMEDLSDLSDDIQEELNKKTIKTRIDYNGTNFILNGSVLNYKQLHDIHLENPDFAFVVYGDRAYLLSYVQDDVGQMRELRFQSVIAVTDSNNLSNVKVSGIYVTSSDGINIASVRVTDINSENKAYKAVEINDGNKNSNVWYPTVGAVVDYSKKEISKVNDKLESLWKLSEGIVYDFQKDANDGDKVVMVGAKEASVLSYGGKSVVWNQLQAFDNTGSSERDGVIASYDASAGTIELNGTPTGSYSGFAPSTIRFPTVTGHNYLVCGIHGGSSTTYRLRCYFGTSISVTGPIVYKEETPRGDAYIVTQVMSGYTAHNLLVSPRCVDLTRMFGAGNEPTSVDDPRIAWIEAYAEAHPEYNAGEIISAYVESVTASGVNLFDAEHVSNNYILNTDNGTIGSANGYWVSDYIPVRRGEVYNCPTKGSARNVIYNPDKSYNSQLANSGAESRGFVIPIDGYIRICGTVEYSSFTFVKGVDVKPYIPYHTPIIRPIPSAIRQLDGYGWSAGAIFNEVDFENKKFIQRVGRIDLGTMEYFKYTVTGGDLFRTTDIPNIKRVSTKRNILVPGFDVTTSGGRHPGTVSGDDNRVDFMFETGAYASSAEFKAAISGVMCYYELSEPIITDISEIIEPFDVEAGGTITFDNTAMLPVPNTVEYLRALNEVVS